MREAEGGVMWGVLIFDMVEGKLTEREGERASLRATAAGFWTSKIKTKQKKGCEKYNPENNT